MDLDFKIKILQKLRMIKWFMFLNVKMINVHCKIYGVISSITIKRTKKIKNLINSLFFITGVQSVLIRQWNIVLKDVSNKIGLNYISLNVQDSNLKLVILYFYLMFKELKLPHHLLKNPMMAVYFHQSNKRLNKF